MAGKDDTGKQVDKTDIPKWIKNLPPPKKGGK